MSVWLPKITGSGLGAAGELVDTVSVNLAVNFATTAQPPVYTTLFTLPLTTVLPSSYLAILFTGNILMAGPSAANNAPNFRFRLNGALLSPGNGTTLNTVRNQIEPIAYSRRVVVAVGIQTVVVECAYFGPVGQTLSISPVALPDLMHAHLTLQEQRS